MDDEEIVIAEQNAALRAAFAELPPRCQQLLSMLMSAPPRSCADIRAELGISVGSTGLQLARCMNRLRKPAAFLALDQGGRPSKPGRGNG